MNELNASERAELEEFRRQEKSSIVMGWILFVAIALAIGGFCVAAYKADAFDGGLDVVKMVRYYRDQPQKVAVEDVGDPLFSLSASTPQADDDPVLTLTTELSSRKEIR